MSAEFIGGDKIKAKLQAMINAKETGLKAAGVSVLTDSQKSIIDSGPGWPGFKRKPKRAHQIEWLTGTMLRSLALGGTSNVFNETDNSVTVGTSVKYAKYQNEGDEHLPARPFLFLNQDRMDRAVAAYLQQLQDAWNNA